MKRILWLGILLWSASLWAHPQQLIIFGDSLSDTRNTYEYTQHHKPIAPWYFKGRYSNGPIWIDRLAEIWFPENAQKHLVNYAFAGAGVIRKQPESFFLSQEVDSYLLTHDAKSAQKLMIIWVGANDYLINPHASETDIAQVIAGIESNIQRLIQNGAKHFLIINLPDLGFSPFAHDLELTKQLSHVSQVHNDHLRKMVKKLSHQYPKTNWKYFDVNPILSDLVHRPKHYGLTHVKEQCFYLLPNKDKSAKNKPILSQKNCQGYLFFDAFHPTTVAHRHLADSLIAFLAV